MQLQRKRIIIATATTLALLAIGTYLLAGSLTLQERKEILLDDSFNVLGNHYENRTLSIPSSGDYVASFTVSNGTIKFHSFTAATLELWQEGQYEPDWVEMDQTDYGMGIELGPQENLFIYLIFVNDDSFQKEVHLEVARVWNEMNYLGLLGGAALVLIGILMALVVISKLR